MIPSRLTETLFRSSRAELIVGTPTKLSRATQSFPQTVTIQTEEGEEECTADAVLIACGPWTHQCARALGVAMSTQVFGLKAHSVLLEPNSLQVADPSSE